MVMLAGDHALVPAHDAPPHGGYDTAHDGHALAQGGRTTPARPAKRIRLKCTRTSRQSKQPAAGTYG